MDQANLLLVYEIVQLLWTYPQYVFPSLQILVEFLFSTGNTNFQECWQRFFEKYLKHPITYHNKQRLSEREGCILVSNHIYGQDPMCLYKEFVPYVVYDSRALMNICNAFMPKKILYNHQKGQEVQKQILELVGQGEKVLIFSEARLRNVGDEGQDLFSFRKGTFFLAFGHNVPILPMVIHYSDRYNKVFTPDSHINVHFLDYVYPSDFENAHEFTEHIYNVMNDLWKSYRQRPLLLP